MSTQGPYSPGTCANDTSVGTEAWSNANNAKASDNAYATASSDVAHGSTYTNYLKATNFGFAIPAGKRIDGIKVEVEKHYGNSPYEIGVSDYRARIIKSNGALGSTDKSAGYWALSDAYATYGGAADLWGEAWTAEDINDADFGFVIAAAMSGTEDNWDAEAYIDHIRITITYSNPIPTAPNGLTRANFDATGSAVFAWTHNSPASLGQSAYQVLVYDVSDGSLDYDSGKVTSATPSMTLPASTLPNNKQYQWKVRTYDTDNQVSPYSDLAVFYTSAKPAASITNPATDGATVSASTLTLGWMYSDPESGAQSAYRAVLKDSGGVILQDSAKTSGSGTSHAFSHTLVNETNYIVDLTLYDNRDIASETVTRTFYVEFSGPPTPTVSYTVNNARGCITLTINNPSPGAGEDALAHNSIYRKKSTESAYIRIATGIAENGSYTDYNVASGVTYNYYVRAVGISTGYSDGAAGNSGVLFSYTRLELVSDRSKYVDLVYNLTRDESDKRECAATLYAGRTKPMHEFGEHEDRQIDLEFSFKDATEHEKFLEIFNALGVMLFRDRSGRREFVIADRYGLKDKLRPKRYNISMYLSITSYSEVV